MNKKALLAIALICLTGFGFWGYERYRDGQQPTLKATGTIEATTVDLTARLYGTIKTFSLQEGDLAEKNQIVAELSRNDLVAQRERDALGVAAAEAKLADLLSGAREQEIEEALAQVEAAQNTRNKSHADLERLEALLTAGAVSPEKVEQARLGAQQAEAQLRIAQARLNLLRSGSRPGVIEAAQAEVDRNRAVLKASQTLLDDLVIKAPLQGTVISRNYEPGEFVTAGSSLATLADLEHLWIKVYIPTDDLPRIKLGQKVTCTVSGHSQSFTGAVRSIASSGEFTPKTIQTEKERTNVVFAVKIDLTNSGGVLKPGMPADVVFVQE